MSTDKQGKSGLGLDAQKAAVKQWLDGGSWQLLASFTEVESGKRVKRPQLEKALAFCKKQKATLLIARLDRLARKLHFISGLMEARVKFVACDRPQATPFELHIYAAMAEEEARTISARTKAALAAAKARGVKLGPHGAVLASRYRTEANEWAARLAPTLREMRERGLSMRAMAKELSKRKVPTPRGGKWHAETVGKVLERIGS